MTRWADYRLKQASAINPGVAVVVRFATPDDMGLIHSSWYKAVRETEPNNLIPVERFKPHMNRTIQSALKTGSVLVMCHPDEPSEILGWVAYEWVAGVLLVHWIYVRRIWRGIGLAGWMMNQIDEQWRSVPIIATQPGPIASLHKAFNKIVYDPYILNE